MDLTEFEIITICYKNNLGLLRTLESCESLRIYGCNQIVVYKEIDIDPFRFKFKNVIFIEQPSFGLYNALNLGIKSLSKSYYILIHSDDIFKSTPSDVLDVIETMSRQSIDLAFNACIIEGESRFRIYSSLHWNRFKMYFGIQPPHPPTIYNTKSTSQFRYSEEYTAISDFIIFDEMLKNNLSYSKSDLVLVYMSRGGVTSSGFKSFLIVTKEFIKYKGFIVGLFWSFTRLFKFFQTRSGSKYRYKVPLDHHH